MALTKGYKALLADADAAVKTFSVEEVHAGQNDPGMVILDIRDVRELKREGMLEFWAAPDSPYFKDWLADPGKTYVLYCASAWRSALAAKDLQDMGMNNIAHMAGGIKAWREAGLDVVPLPEKKKG